MDTTWMSPTASENTFQTAEASWNLIGDQDGQSPFAPGDDDAVKLVTLPYPVTWYCTQFNEMWISVNGWISFGPDQPSWSYQPDEEAPNTLAVMWVDMVLPSDSGQIKASQVGGVDPHVVVSWEGIRTWSNRNNVDAVSYTTQVRLYPSGKFKIDWPTGRGRQCPVNSGPACGTWTKGPDGVPAVSLRSITADEFNGESLGVCNTGSDTCTFGAGNVDSCSGTALSEFDEVAVGKRPDNGAGGTEKVVADLDACAALCKSSPSWCMGFNFQTRNYKCKVFSTSLASESDLFIFEDWQRSWVWYARDPDCVSTPPPTPPPTSTPTTTAPTPLETTTPTATPTAAPTSCEDQLAAITAANLEINRLLAENLALRRNLDVTPPPPPPPTPANQCDIRRGLRALAATRPLA